MSASAQITILIPDPDEMMFVTGSNDTNIDRIEREFAVKIVSRGAELRAIVERIVAETGAAGPRDMGKVMPKVLAETKDRADGKKVAGLVGAMLKEKAPS